MTVVWSDADVHAGEVCVAVVAVTPQRRVDSLVGVMLSARRLLVDMNP